MNIKRLGAAIDEAKRFLAHAEAARSRLLSDDLVSLTGSKETGAARRASMDLTRALSDLRRSP